MNTYLLITSIVIFLCILLNRVSNRIGIPALLAFIVLGMLFGSDGIMKIDFDNYAFAEQICSTALIFIMFYGGFGTNWQRAKAVAVKSVLLSTIGVIITCFLTGLFCHFALNMSWEISFLLGALISSTDAASVFSILRSKKLNLKYIPPLFLKWKAVVMTHVPICSQLLLYPYLRAAQAREILPYS